MSQRTCVLKSKECPDEEKCIKNILSHLNCLSQKRKGLKKNCEFFDIRDCKFKIYNAYNHNDKNEEL